VTLGDDLHDSDRRMLRRLVENHRAHTDSDRAAELLEDWEAALSNFVKVMPDAYAGIIAENEEEDVRRAVPESATPVAGEDAATARGRSDD